MDGSRREEESRRGRERETQSSLQQSLDEPLISTFTPTLQGGCSPHMRLPSSQLHAVDARLLTGANANHLPPQRVADGIALGKADADGGQQQIPLSGL